MSTTPAASGYSDTPVRFQPLDGSTNLVMAMNYERGEEIGKQDYLQIGDSVFQVAPTSIAVIDSTNNHAEDVLRTPGGIVMANGFAEKQFNIELMFTTTEQIYGLSKSYSSTASSRQVSGGYLGAPVNPNSFAALIAQFTKTPIVPVVNKFINFTHNTYALALEGFITQTVVVDNMPIPNCLKVTLIAKAFAIDHMCPGLSNFDDAIIYPLQRWFWRQHYSLTLPGQYTNYNFSNGSTTTSPVYPHSTGMLGTFQLLTIDRNWTNAIDTLRNEFSQKLNYSQTTEFRTRVSMDNQVKYQLELKQLSDQITRLSSENNARLVPWNFGKDLVLTSISAQVKNNFTPLRIPDSEFPTYQHMSTGDVRISCSFTALSESTVAHFQAMVSEARSLSRDIRFEAIAGFIGFENEIISLMGVHSVVFTDLQVATMPGYPDTYIIALEMIAFDRMQRRLESVQSSQDTPKYYLDQVAPSYGDTLLEGQNEDPNDPQVQFWQRYRNQKKPSKLSTVPSGTVPDDNASDSQSVATDASSNSSLPGLDPTGRPTNAWFNMAYIQEALEQQASLELYPDLQLPTFNRLKRALTTNEIFTSNSEQSLQLLVQELRWRYWGNEGKYIDPDFYIDYPNDNLASKLQVVHKEPGNPSDYLQNAVVSGNSINPLDIVGINFSVSNFLSNGLFDTHPAVAGVGPDIQQNPTQSGDSGPARGQTKVHMYATMPSATGNTTNIMQSALNSQLGIINGQLIAASGSTPAPETAAQLDAGGIPGNSNDVSSSTASSGSVSTADPTNSAAGIGSRGAGGPFGGSSGAPSFADTVVIQGQTYNIIHADDTSTGPIANFQAFSKVPGLSGTQNGQTESPLTTAVKQIGGSGDTGPQINQALMAHHPIDIGSTVNDEHGRLIAMCNDVLSFDVTGRLVQAFPSYVFQLLDEGPRLGWVKIFPNFFALQAISSLDIIIDRREPADTAIIELMNSYGNVSSYTALQLAFGALVALDRASLIGEPAFTNLVGDVASGIGGNASAVDNLVSDFVLYKEGIQNAITSFIPDQDLIDNTIALRQKQSGQIMLAPGVRCHIRMGYGSNGGRLPVVFNGRITDIGYGERMRIIAQGDGTELANLIPTAESETNSINRPDRSFLQTSGSDLLQALKSFTFGDYQQLGQSLVSALTHLTEMTYEPRELICNMLNSHGEELYDYGLGTKFWNFCKSTIWASTNGAMFQDNPIGISHFGNPYLFNLWGAIANNSLDAIPDPSNQGNPQQLASFVKTQNLAAKPNATIPQILLAASKNLFNATNNIGNYPISTNIGEVTGSGLTGLGNTLGQLGNAVNSTGSDNGTGDLLTLSGFAIKLVGEGATLLNHDIPVGFGETGENVYPIYTPFSELCQQAGTFMSLAGLQALQSGILGAGSLSNDQLGTINNATTTASQINNNISAPLPDLSTGIGHTPLAGAHLPGVTFNMYTKNKRAWDVITTCAQYFPPYVAAARPFEYRSTLFFGAPYFQYRYAYNRVSSYQLGQVGNDSLDLYYGYPVGYQVKTFAQYHYYDSKFNLLDDDIRASDEDTFTDIIAMWYKGQGFSGQRPTPFPTHQTVDRQIAPALRKTAIVNTDVLGLDMAPTGAAIMGSCGGALVGYWAEHFLQIPGTDFGVHGAANFFITEQNMRNMSRAMLRDYQKLMYQGHILVVGDPTVKPHDLMFINDGYLDIKGGAGVRRVIHHFGFETGFVTSIEPDLLVEVKGQNFMTSYWQWLFGYLSMDIVARVSSEFAINQSRAKFTDNLFRFGYKIVGKSGTKAALRRLPTRTAISKFRNIFLTQLGKYINKGSSTKSSVEQIANDIVNLLKNQSGLPFGEKSITSAMRQEAQAKVLDIINTGFDGLADSELISSEAGKVILTMSSAQLDAFAAQVANNVVLRRGLTNFIERGAATISQTGLSEYAEAQLKNVSAIIAKKAAGSTTAAAATDAIIATAEKIVPIFIKIGTIGKYAVGGPIGLLINVAVGFAWTAVSRWWDDQTSLQMSFLQYHGIELQAGLNGHTDSIVFRTAAADDENLTMTAADLQYARLNGQFQLRPDAESAITYLATPTNSPAVAPAATGNQNINTGGGVGAPFINVPNPTSPLSSKTGVYSTAQRQAIMQQHIQQGGSWTAQAQSDFVDSNIVTDGLVKLFDQLQGSGIDVGVYCFRTGHSTHTDTGKLSDHGFGRAADITSINKVDIGKVYTPQIVVLLQFLTSPLIYNSLHQIGLWEPLYMTPWSGYGKIFEDNDQPHIHVATTS